MEVNFFGLIQVTKKAMEVMREQKPSGSSLLSFILLPSIESKLFRSVLRAAASGMRASGGVKRFCSLGSRRVPF